MALKILITGGTFDKEYDEIKGSLYFKETHMTEILELGRSRVDVNIEKLMLIDSLDMTSSQRELIVNRCLESEDDQIVITHGTDTMTITGKALAEKFALEGWKVAASARRKEILSDMANNKNISSFPLDVTDQNQIKAVFEKIISDFGSLDLCVFSSGTYDPKLEQEINIKQNKLKTSTKKKKREIN